MCIRQAAVPHLFANRHGKSCAKSFLTRLTGAAGRQTLKILAVVIFIALYEVLITKPKYRVQAALIAAAAFILTGILPLSAVPGAINYNVLMMMAGTMVAVYYFIESKMPNLLADLLLAASKNVMWVTIFMSLFAGAISAFIDNVATVVMVAPVGLAVCKKLKINPVSMILAIAVSSNLQGAATLVGDTTSIMLGAYAKMDFLDFFWMNGRPGMFFAVELGALLTVPVMMILFRKDTQSVEAKERTKVEDLVPTVLLVSLVVILILASFIKNKPEITNGVICMLIALGSILYDFAKYHSKERAVEAIKSIDFETLLLLVGLFLVIEGITQAGIIDDLAAFIVKAGGSNMFLLYTIIVWGSVAISAFVDNIPYVATMLPVLTVVTNSMGVSPYLLYFGLLTGATLGGNLTPIGASANIAGVGLLKREGHEVSFKDFMRIGVPFTLTAVMTGYLFVWIFWHTA